MQNSAVLYRKSLTGRRPKNQASAPPVSAVQTALPVTELPGRVDAWIQSCEIRMLSPNTTALRQICFRLLREYLDGRKSAVVGEEEMRGFFHHITAVRRRAGTSQATRLRPSSIKTYHSHMTVFFEHLVKQEVIASNPMQRIEAPVVRQEQIQPFTTEQVKALLVVTKHGFYPKRDRAVILLLLDTGMRANELCCLRWGSVDLNSRKCLVLGKGNKYREVFFSTMTYRAITEYRREETSSSADPSSPLFYSDRGTRTGEGLTPSGLLQLIKRLGEKAGVQAVRCSPHTFRHTFALNFLRSGGTPFALKETLGHTNLDMTQKYVRLASADIERQNKINSPVEFMLKGK